MREEEFRSWLATHRNLSERTIGSRISNCRTVERHEGDLDNQFEQDKLQELTRRLTYSSQDQAANRPARHDIPIDGNVYNVTATLRSAVSLYKQFREQVSENSETLLATREGHPSTQTRKKTHFRNFFLQFVSEKGVSRNTVFTEAEVLAWFKATYPERAPQHIHDQLLKKATNYPRRVRFVPSPSQVDDLFFALDPEFQTFRLYRENEDPPPIYKEREAGFKQLLPTEMEIPIDNEASVSPYPGQNDLKILPGTVLQKRYRIIRKLGEGGMGAVYEALDQRLDCVVALKEATVAGDEARRAFHREASLLANLRHRALPNVMDHFSESNVQFLVMEFIPGEDLAGMLKKRERFEPAHVLGWADFLLRTLEYLHARNPPILHRDIKPANLKLTEDDELFLLDFGLAKGRLGQMQTMLTTRSIFGHTPVYSPLEQIIGAGTDPRSDLYALGATLYHLLTGRVPVDAPTRYNTTEEGGIDPLRPACTVNEDISRNLSDVIQKAMAIGRRERWNSATEMRDALRNVTANKPIAGQRREASTIASSSKKQTQQRIVFLNNCQNRDHVGIYGSDAFYDLNAAGFQSTLALNLPKGQLCIVASTGSNNEIVFSWYSFAREELRRDYRGVRCRVFFGMFIKSEQYSKAEAARKEPYTNFFDVNGNFKRHSVHTSFSIIEETTVKRRKRSRTSEKEFFEILKSRSPADAKVAKTILDWSRRNFTQVNWKGSSFVPVLHYGARFSHNPITVYAIGKPPRVGIKFGRMKRRNGLPEDKRIELLRRLNNIPGVSLPTNSVDRYPNILLSTLTKQKSLEQFLEAIEWTNEEVKALRT